MNEENAFAKEIETIAAFREQGHVLANHTAGGEGKGKKASVTDEFREKMRRMVTGANNPNYHHRWSEKQKKHLSDLRKANGMAKGGKNPRAKRVMCVETGKIYACQQDAADDLGLRSMASIHHALKNPHFVAKGLHFVQGDWIDQLDSVEKRQQYLSSLNQPE